ncbi:EamA/RhaT family transporter [Arcobacter venerupis]|uniref:EamA/RhaT family transporter n=1 Tax=Arcobacter venerupis TaxID=1054033 RepID=A0AAE7E3A7_9BACT|nr:DMT family transporter [Arcobacter venerupis]QKF65782.1 EamA/RhaT family transporter [Arcobacter venerupis]RWS50291.1 EamA family transporter [Arcobacter venerupis]
MTNNAKGLALTSLGILIMSLESLFIKFTTISPFLFSFYIGIFMFSSTMFTFIFKDKEHIKKAFKTSLPFLIICSIMMGSSNIFFITAIKTTTVANVVIIFSTAALFSALFAYLLYKEKVSRNIYFASFFMFVGLYIIFSDKLEVGSIKGNIFALLCTIFFSISFVFLSRYKDMNRVVLTAFSGISLSVIAFFFTDDLQIDSNTLLIIVIMGLLITPISRVLIGHGAKYISASEVSLLMLIETIMAPIWVWLFLNEIPSANTFIGGSLIIGTLIVNSVYTLKKGE